MNSDRKTRWQCPECNTVNRAFRNVCFATDCDCKRPVPSQSTTKKETEESFVTFKDENGNIIANIPSAIATPLKQELQYMVQGLAAAAPLEQETAAKTCALQTLMRQGRQIATDFDDTSALWGYARRKFSIRAVAAFALIESAVKVQPRMMLEDITCVVSMGGGPGNDLFGYLLFQKYGRSDATTALRRAERCFVLDFAPGWESIVNEVADLSGRSIGFINGDLSKSLQDNPDLLLNETCVRLYMFSYVLSEIMGHDGDPPALLQDLLLLRPAVYIFREPLKTSSLTRLIIYFRWTEGLDCWKLPHGGLLVVTRSTCHCVLLQDVPTQETDGEQHPTLLHLSEMP